MVKYCKSMKRIYKRSILMLLVGLVLCFQSYTKAQVIVEESGINTSGNSSLILRKGRPPNPNQPPQPITNPGGDMGKPLPLKGVGENPASMIPKAILPAPPIVVTGTGSNYGNLTLRLEPLTIRCKAGQTVSQDIILDNPKGFSIDEVEVVIKYPSEFLEVLDMDPDTPGVNLEEGINFHKNPGVQYVLNQVDVTKGEIHLYIKTMAGNVYVGHTLATIKWYAKKPRFYIPLTFIFPESSKSPGTKVTKSGKDMLGSNYDPKDGVITGGIAILSGEK
jgi:hypothetical protein